MLFDSTTSAVETIDIHQLILERDEDVLFLMAGMAELARASSEVFHHTSHKEKHILVSLEDQLMDIDHVDSRCYIIS